MNNMLQFTKGIEKTYCINYRNLKGAFKTDNLKDYNQRIKNFCNYYFLDEHERKNITITIK